VFVGSWSGGGLSHSVGEKKEEKKEERGPLVSVTLAGLEPDSVYDLLFRLDEAKTRISADGKLNVPYHARQTDGAVFRALYGALFIDEIEKASDGVRSLLLRFLESKEIILSETRQSLRLEDEQVPQYLFAGSMNRRTMFEKQPADFWTRVSHVVEMSHPLDLGETDGVRFVTREYIAMFWRKHIGEFLKQSGHIGEDLSLCPSREMYTTLVLPYFHSLQQFLVSPSVVRFVSHVLADELIGGSDTLPSVRRIRGVVGRSVYRATEMLMHPKDAESPIERLKFRKRGEQACDAWFSPLCALIGKAHRGEDTAMIERGDLAFIEEFTETLRQGASFSR